MTLRKVMKKLFALLGAILSLMYLISPVDLIPGDLTTIVGLIDDVAVLPIFIGCLKVLGLDVSRLLGGKGKKQKKKEGGEIVDID